MRLAITSVLLLALGGLSAVAKSPSLKSLYHQHRWFELRDAINNMDAPPALYRGAVASAFNDNRDAVKYLNQVIKQDTDSNDVAEAHEKLVDIYNRLGMSHETLQQFDAILKMDPKRRDVESLRPIFASFSRYPDQSIGKQRRTIVHAEISKHGIVIPLSINGKVVHWLLDTDFSMSIMSESEARMLGLTIDNGSAHATDLNGGSTTIHSTVVPQLAIGNVQLRNVPFVIMPDSQQPWDEWPSGRKGIIGLPVAIALQAIAWKSDGTFEIGFAPKRPANRKMNLCFDAMNPITRAQFQGRDLDLILDTGNTAGTQLWPRFATDFAAMVKQEGTKSTKQINQVGGSSIRETTLLPEISLRVGGLETKLQPATIFSRPVGDHIHHGLLGMDMLSQAREVRIDFRAMTLQLLP